MTPAEFKAARNTLCLSQRDLAEVWGMGEQMVIPGCEKKPSPWARGPQQMSLF